MTIIDSYSDAIQPERFEEQRVWLGKEMLEKLPKHLSRLKIFQEIPKDERDRKRTRPSVRPVPQPALLGPDIHNQDILKIRSCICMRFQWK